MLMQGRQAVSRQNLCMNHHRAHAAAGAASPLAGLPVRCSSARRARTPVHTGRPPVPPCVQPLSFKRGFTAACT